MSTIPFGSDDWAWGTSVGMERLASHFAGYNGRYLGNLLIIFLTKNAFIKTIGMAVISFAVVLLIYEYIGKDRFLYFLFPLLLLFLCRQMCLGKLWLGLQVWQIIFRRL